MTQTPNSKANKVAQELVASLRQKKERSDKKPPSELAHPFRKVCQFGGLDWLGSSRHFARRFFSESPLLRFFAPGVPAPEPRPRATAGGRIYVPSDADAWKHGVRAAAVAAVARFGGDPEQFPRTGLPFGVAVDFVFARPASHFRSGRFSAVLRDAAPAAHVSRPDADNLLKSTLDALGEWQDLPSLLWANDSQVAAAFAAKRWASPVEVESGFLGAMVYVFDFG